jgi:hypothetical protein
LLDEFAHLERDESRHWKGATGGPPAEGIKPLGS